LDISTPETPEKIGYYITPSSGIGICTADSFIYIAAGDAGLQIYENLLWEGIEEEPINTDSPLLLTVSLNRLSYDVPGQAFLTLYSSDGRRVLEETIQGKGTWTPSSLPSGVYFARVECKAAHETQKVILIH
jgi:hypothetical protein